MQAPNPDATVSRGLLYDQAEHELERYDVVRALVAGEYFGELACLTGVRRTATVVAVQYSETMSLSKDALDATVSEFPAYKFSISTEVEGYNELVQELIGRKQQASDVASEPPAGGVVSGATAGGGAGVDPQAPGTAAAGDGSTCAGSRLHTSEQSGARGREQQRGGSVGGGAQVRSRSAPSTVSSGSSDNCSQLSMGGSAGSLHRGATAAATAARTGLLERMRLLDVAVEVDPEREGVPGAVSAAESRTGASRDLDVVGQEADARRGDAAGALEDAHGAGGGGGGSSSINEIKEVVEAGVARVHQITQQLQQQMGSRRLPAGQAMPGLLGSAHPVWGNGGAGGLAGPIGPTIRSKQHDQLGRNELHDFMRGLSNVSGRPPNIRTPVETSLDLSARQVQGSEGSEM